MGSGAIAPDPEAQRQRPTPEGAAMPLSPGGSSSSAGPSTRSSTAWPQQSPQTQGFGAVANAADHVHPLSVGNVAAGSASSEVTPRQPLRHVASQPLASDPALSSSRPTSAKPNSAQAPESARGEATLEPPLPPPEASMPVPRGLRHAATDSALSTAAERVVKLPISAAQSTRRNSIVSRLSQASLGAPSDGSAHKLPGQAGIASSESGQACEALPPPQCAMQGRGLAGSSGAALRPAMCAFPTADPDYDETAVPEAAELAAKYGGAWLRAVLPSRAPAAHPLQMASVRHVDGSISIVHADHVRPLQAGCSLFVGGEAHLTALHQHLPKGLHYIPANMYDWGTAEPRYMTVHFAAPGHLFVLLPEDTVEPRWLRQHFHKLREPLYGIKVTLQCSWDDGGIADLIIRVMTASRKANRHAVLHVYKSKRLYNTGEVEHLGGVPTAHFGENMYILGACSASEDEVQREIGVLGPGGVAGNISDWALWYPRMLKSVRRNRLEDVRFLLKSDAWIKRPFRADPISWLPPEEVDTEHNGSPLTSDLAVGFGSVEMLALLVAECHCQLSVRGLRLLVHKWEEVPAEHGGALDLLLGYLRRCPRPLGTVACILATLRREIERRDRARSSSTLELRAVLRRFEELQTQLLYALADVVRHGGPEGGSGGGHGMAWLQAVVDPPQHPRPLVLADHSPLRIAFDDKDFGFMASVVMEGYTRQKWMGTALLALTSRDGTGGLTILDPSILLTVMRRLGLCDDGILAAALFRVARLWYLCCVVPAAFIGSPRGRWCMRLLSCVAFIIVFNIVLNKDPNVDVKGTLVMAGVFSAFLLGSLVESVETVAVAYQGSVSRFARRNPQEVAFLVVEALSLSLTFIYMFHITQKAHVDEVVVTRLVIVWSSLAVVFYVKFLYTLVPLVQRLGPLLNTVVNMMSELSAFLLPFIVITTGFATSYNIIFSGIPGAGLDTFGDGMLMLFEAFLTSFDMSRWEEMPLQEFRLFGILLTVIYLVLAGILLANLLIAIISYKYRPDEVAAQSIFGLAEVVDRHQLQVDTALLCSPFCLLQIPFNLLPHGTRPAILPYSFFRLGLAPLEGFRPAAPHLNTVPTGRDAVPQLLFHLTLHPIMLVATNLAFYAISPLCVLYFTFHGHKEVWEKLWPRKEGSKAKASGKDTAAASFAPQLSRAGSKGLSMQMTMQTSQRVGSRVSGSFESEGTPPLGVLYARSGDPWQHVGGYCTLKGIVALSKALSRMTAAFLSGAMLCYGPIGLFLVTCGGTWMWLACTSLSIYNVMYEPMTRMAAALAWRRWRKRLHRGSVVVDGGSAHPTASNPDPPLSTSESGEQDVAPVRSATELDPEASVVEGADPSAAAEPRHVPTARSTMAGQIAHKWAMLANGAARRGAVTRYLTRQQVESAIARTFGYTLSATVALAAGGSKAAGSKGPAGPSAAGPTKPFMATGEAAAHPKSESGTVQYIRAPHFNLRAAEQQQEARDIAVLGRVLPGETATTPCNAVNAPGSADKGQKETATAPRPSARGAGSPAASAKPELAVAEGHHSGTEPKPGGASRPGTKDVPEDDVYAKLEELELENQELRSQVQLIVDLLGNRLAYGEGREEARQQRRAVLLQAYGDENY